MQEEFINELIYRSNENIEEKNKKIRQFGDEICVLISQNEHLDDQVFGLTQLFFMLF